MYTEAGEYIVYVHMGTRWRSWLRQCATCQMVVGKGGWCIGLTTLPPSCADCVEVLGASTPLEP